MEVIEREESKAMRKWEFSGAMITAYLRVREDLDGLVHLRTEKSITIAKTSSERMKYPQENACVHKCDDVIVFG